MDLPSLNQIGAGLMALIFGALGWIGGGSKRRLGTASDDAQTDVVNLLSGEIDRLAERLVRLESREGKLIQHIYRLEGLMRSRGIDPPLLDFDEAPFNVYAPK